jgi:DNA repair protein RadA/Sms
MFPWRATSVLPQKEPLVAKRQTTYYCGACGFEAPKWIGRCPSCDAWNSFDETPRIPKQSSGRASHAARSLAAPLRIADVENVAALRLSTGIHDFDDLLGGGIVPGGVMLVAGPPGVGKSTLALAVASSLAGGLKILYACAEESAAQTKLRAARLAASDEILLAAGDDVEAIVAAARETRPALLVVDSIQTVFLPGVDGAPGSVSQVRECAQMLTRFGKESGCAVLLVGHVTKDGSIAGPKVLEHLVDVVLSFEGEHLGTHRLLRATKNRFGATDGVCVFEMAEGGLREVRDPSHVFLGERRGATPGAAVVATLAGARPLLAEVQALVSAAGYSSPRRLVSGLDYNRVCMIVAVLERRLGMQLSTSDVYTSVVGGLRVAEPAVDLGIAVAIVSALRDRSVAHDLVCFGEVGLAGELRDVNGAARRIAEAEKLGFKRAIVPASARTVYATAALSVSPARTLSDAIAIAFAD